MRAETVEIERFRSAREVLVENLGTFNVLIGKNNAGKSTILWAIAAFFACIKEGGPVQLDPPIGQGHDYFASATGHPIEIKVGLRLDEKELNNLKEEVARSAPQFEELARAFSTEDRLQISLAVSPPPSPYAYIKRVELSHGAGSPRVLLEIGPETAEELRDKAVSLRTNKRNRTFLRDLQTRLGETEWTNYRNIHGASPLQYWNPRAARERLSPPMETRVNELWQGLETYEAFISEIAALADFLAGEIQGEETNDLGNPVKTFGGDLSRIPEYVTSLLAAVGRMKVHYLRERREPIGRQEAQQLLELKVKRGGLDRLREIQTTIEGLLGVTVDAFEGEDEPGPRGKAAEMDVDNFLVQVNGAGIREALRIVLDVEFFEPDVLLVEEPEIHLHPAMETSLMQYLKRIGQKTQVLLSTHSTNFLDVAEMRNVYLVAKESEETHVQLLNPSDVEAEVPRELGIRLSSLFMFDRLAFVEGPTDEAVLRELATTLSANLSHANVGFIPMGGARNFAYFAAEGTLSFLGRRQVDVWFVLDRDERDEVEVQRMTEQAGTESHVVILQRRELENYLIDPSAVQAFIMLKRELAGRDPLALDHGEVEEALDECAEELKEFTVVKRIERRIGGPVYLPRDREGSTTRAGLEAMRDTLDQRLSDLDAVEADTRSEVERQWDERKLSLVPGDELLDCVCKRWGVRYHKDRGDGARLASLVDAEQIGPDLKELLLSLAA